MSKMTLLDALNDSLDRLHAGQNILDCLSVHSDHADALRPLLEAHMQVRAALPDQNEIAAAQARGRARVLAALRADPVVPVQHTTPASRIRRLPARVLSIAAALALLFGVLSVLMAQNALPGDALYGVKQFSESVLLSLDENDTLRERFAKRRIDEIESLLAAGRAETVSFSGQIETQAGARWIVAGLVLDIPTGTPGANIASVGDVVNIRAATRPDRTLIALSIERESDDENPVEELLPTQTPFPTETATLAPTETTTLAPTETVTPSPTETTTPTPTVTPSATAEQECVAQLPGGWVTYHVRPGDTLSAIAVATGTTVDQLASVNCLEDPRSIVSGELLFVPRVPDTAVPASAPQVTSPPPPAPLPANPPPPGPTDDDDDDGDDDDSWDDDDDDDDSWDDDDDI